MRPLISHCREQMILGTPIFTPHALACHVIIHSSYVLSFCYFYYHYQNFWCCFLGVISKHSCTHFFRTSCRNRLFQFLPYFSIFHRMSFEDFCRYFSKATMCHLMNTSIFSLSKRWHIFKHKNEWKPDSSAGGCVTNQATFFKNPQVLKIIWSVSCNGPCLTGHQLVNHFPLQP